jgi:hypothetical protein
VVAIGEQLVLLPVPDEEHEGAAQPVEQPLAGCLIPAEEEVGKAMSVTAAPGEYEPATFIIRAAKDLTGVLVTADDLRSKTEGLIAKTNIDIRVMKVWYPLLRGPMQILRL